MSSPQPHRATAASYMLKRVIDVSSALIGLVIFAPLLLAAALAVRLKMGAPVLFVQLRPGRDGRLFTMYKLRTMVPRLARHDRDLSDEERLTRLGSWLRSTSIDELPALWNVLRGDMSLVGPRPLLPEYLPLYTRDQARRHEVRPGITGWAQIHGRNGIPWAERFELDVWYVDHWSLALDALILWRTAGRVWHRDGIAAPGVATMPPFTGTR